MQHVESKLKGEAVAVVPRAEFAKAMQLATAVVERRHYAPILTNVRLTGGADGLTVRASDLDIQTDIIVPGTAGKNFATTLPAHMLRDAARKAQSDDVRIAVNGKPSAALRFGAVATELQSLPVADFPEIEAPGNVVSFSMPADALCEALRHVEFAISTEETRYYLNGVYMHAYEKYPRAKVGRYALRFVATDGHRMAVYETDCPKGAEKIPGVIVPRKTVATILKAFGAKRKKGESAFDIAIEINPAKVRFTAGNVSILSKTIDGTYPDYGRVTPRGNDKIATLDVAEFVAGIEAATVISSERGRAVKLQFSKDKVRLSVDNPDAGTSSNEVACEYNGAPLDIGFNSRYLADILDKCGEVVRMELSDPGSPTILKSRDGGAFYAVLMPMRV